MNLKKYGKLIFVFIIILVAVFITWQKKMNKPVSSNVYLGYFTQMSPKHEALLQETYGQSPYYIFYGDIKISIEKTIKEKYYMVYSWVTGDQSYFAVNSIIEDTKKNKIKKEDFNSMYLKDDRGKTYFPLPYYNLVDYPSDQPLGWKQILYVKFYPLDEGVKEVDIYITYKGVQKIIKRVKVN